jgi:beta-xylosidase
VIATPPGRLHSNPVHDGYLADPFVWRHGGSYYAIGTGDLEANGTPESKIFPILKSENFYEWHFLDRAMLRPDTSLGENFWAPAVAAKDDRFYLYYSVGQGDRNHQLRVAVSEQPEGPYKDVGQPLVDPGSCPFAIDPHPFQDEDGRWYLFYARDFVDSSNSVRAGTALLGAAMKSMTELQEQGTPFLRARSDWQRFKADREMYGGTYDWHTLEGPCVWRHAGKYYCFYSGGCWQNDTYGVDYGVSDHVLGPYSDAGNEFGPRVLRTIPSRLIGPGHNTVITGPNSQTDYLVYHAWDRRMTRRQMHVSPLIWTAAGPRCDTVQLNTIEH